MVTVFQNTWCGVIKSNDTHGACIAIKDRHSVQNIKERNEIYIMILLLAQT